ncbi:MAG: TPM domain-containing protein, partial [Deltaproteobacteria bacterium]|nr:TPM domain-containing protein [Deltaproteobacteria bacterium]
MGHLLRACALMAGLLLARAIAAQEFPAPTAHVSDFAHLWSAATTEQLNTELTAFAQRTRIEVAIVSLLSLENDTVENVAVRLFKAWGIGKRGE